MLWMMVKDAFVTVVAQGDPAVSDDLRCMLVQVMRTFLKDVRDVAPALPTRGWREHQPNTANANPLAVSSGQWKCVTSSVPRTG